jgi:preprotein translocase subunit SecD
LNPEGARLFAELTRANVGQQLAILVDGEVYSAPVIAAPITGGRVSISGQFTHEEASDLATLLANPLEVPLRIIEEQAY